MNARTIICTLAGLLSVGFLLWLTPQQVLLPQGMLLPAQHVRAPISSDQVTIYHQVPAARFTRLGALSIEQGFNALNATTKNLLDQKIKSLAAKVGANGVIVNFLAPYNGVRQMLVFRGTAIYIPSATRSAN